MLTVKEVSKVTGVSIRTLHYYDQIGLLEPTEITEAGYRLYDDIALERLQQILLFRELEFPLKEIKEILESDNFDRNKALKQQIELLTLKKEHIENLINFARGIKLTGVKNMDFKAFDSSKIDEYTKKAKRQWGDTDAYKEFESKEKNRTKEESDRLGKDMMNLFVEFGEMMEAGMSPEEEGVQIQVKKLQDYITENFYQCTNEILQGLGKMYAGGGEFTENIDKFGGKGCAEFTADAIDIFCNK
jgi:DNA-binding transcriptional MerR regulator